MNENISRTKFVWNKILDIFGVLYSILKVLYTWNQRLSITESTCVLETLVFSTPKFPTIYEFWKNTVDLREISVT